MNSSTTSRGHSFIIKSSQFPELHDPLTGSILAVQLPRSKPSFMPAWLFVEQAWLKPDVGSPFKHTTKPSRKDRMALTEAAERGAEQKSPLL
jgi:hypothetical protein